MTIAELDTVVSALFAQSAPALVQANRIFYSRGETIGGLRLTFNVRKAKEVEAGLVDLPPVLQSARPQTRRYFRVLADLRTRLGDDAEVFPSDILEHTRRIDPTGDEPSIDTINHSLKDLRGKELVWRHPKLGYLLGRGQTRLPNLTGQSSPPSPTPAAGYPGDVERIAVHRHSTRGPVMFQPLIWVPGEYANEKLHEGVVLQDAVTEREVLVTERLGKITVESRTGRRSTVPAARCELVRREGKYVWVKAGGTKLQVRVLGEWQLKGLEAPEPEEVGSATSA